MMSKLMMVIVALLMSFGAHAESEVVDGVTWHYSVADGNAWVRNDSSSPAISVATTGAITIPSFLGGCPVTTIGDGAFSGCSGLTAVTIPSSVTCIMNSAFSGCDGLMSVTIPSSVKSIYSSAFSDCSGLVEFFVSLDNPNYRAENRLLLTKNGESLVHGVSGDVMIPTSVTSIGDSAFWGCSGLTSVTIPSTVKSIGISAFGNCKGLIAITIPSSVTSIGDWAFFGCSGLTRVAIPPNVTSIGCSVFQGCGSLSSATILEGVMNIGDDMFHDCSGLMSITIPSSVKVIGNYAFCDCSGMTSVTIPSNVTSIGNCAFYGCSSLKSVMLLGAPPKGVVDSYLLAYAVARYPKEYGAEWQNVVDISKFEGYRQQSKPTVTMVSVAIRENDPTVMDVVYKANSAKPMVKVRALAFQDGERSFAKVVRPTEFIEGTAVNVGDEIAANVEHKLSWRVSADWKIDLAKVKFEVLAVEEDLLPLELTTIPRTANHAAMEISWNVITEQQYFDALLWLYADGAEGLTVEDGVLKHNGFKIASSKGIVARADGSPRGLIYDSGTVVSIVGDMAPAPDYVFSKMGFSVLSGDELKYANEMTRLGLSPSRVRQYAWREVND